VSKQIITKPIGRRDLATDHQEMLFITTLRR